MTNENSKKKVPRQKSLTLKQLEKDYKKIGKWSTYVLDEEENLVIKYKEKFNQEEVDQIIVSLYDAVERVMSEEYNFFTDEGQIMKYLHFLMIKQFTHLGKDIGDTFEEQTPVMTQLLSTGLFEFIFEHIFEPDEVMKVIKKYQERVDVIKRIGEFSQQIQQEYAEKIQNKKVLGQAFDDVIQKS